MISQLEHSHNYTTLSLQTGNGDNTQIPQYDCKTFFWSLKRAKNLNVNRDIKICKILLIIL